MDKAISQSTLIKAAKEYLKPGITIKEAANKYKINYTKLSKYFTLLEDEELRREVDLKLSKTPKPNRDLELFWKGIKGKRITKKQLVDWYVDYKGPDNITVNKLIEIARMNGVEVIA